MDGMTEKGTTEPAGLSERPQEAGGDKSAGGPPPQRSSAKQEAVTASTSGFSIGIISLSWCGSKGAGADQPKFGGLEWD